MGDNAGPDRSSVEVKALLRKLDPKSGSSHKDRVRLLNRFRNYAEGGGRGGDVTTPEFYDDDLPLLLLGSQSPTALYDDELSSMHLYGLLQACGCASSHDSKDNHQLKRSARNAMNLLKFLVCDFVDKVKGRPVPLETDPRTGQKELNGFAHALCCCTATQLALMKAHLHVTGENDARGGARDDCCQVLVLLITRHLAENGETPQPLGIDKLLPTAAARKSFDTWLMQNASKATQKAVKRAKAETDGKKKKEKKKERTSPSKENKKASISLDDDDEDVDVLGAFGKKKKKEGGSPKGGQDRAAAGASTKTQGKQPEERGLSPSQRKDGKAGGPGGAAEAGQPQPTKWADSTLADSKVDDLLHTGERERQQTAKEKRRLEEEKRRLATRDPLHLRNKDFDLSRVQEHRVDLLQQAITDVEEAMTEDGIPIQKAGSSSSKKARKAEGLDHIVSLQAQRDALEKILEGREVDDKDAKVGISVDDVKADSVEDLSIIPSDPNFDPLLFLTLVHRNASFEQLQTSIAKLDNKADNQVQRLQNMVRDNFELFVRCADGIELFNLEGSAKSAPGKGKGKGKGKDDAPGVKERLDKLEALSESSSYQAKKSFKPLLDNTNEVRKVQSALAVLQRIGPLLQVPTLMRQHIENGRYAAAVKAYRRVLVIDDNNNIEILRHIKAKATEAAREARGDLESTIADPNTPVTKLLDGIRDLNELIDLDVPMDTSHAEGSDEREGVFSVGNLSINVRNHTPALACLLLQSAHFSASVEKLLQQAETSTQRIYNGETVSFVEEDSKAGSEDASGSAATSQEGTDKGGDNKSGSRREGGNRWKYDILEARVVATKRAVAVARNWLPRLLRIGVAAREAERRLSARKRTPQPSKQGGKTANITSFEIFVTTLTPAVTNLVEHATFCALGCSNSSNGEELKMTFGANAERRLQSLLRAPLPPAQSAKCASELADVWEVVHSISASSETLRPEDDELEGRKFSHRMLEAPMEVCVALAEDAVVTVERRRCIYAFDVCARSCAQRASGNGTFDGDALLSCVQKLSEELTRAEKCANEVEKGCELVVRRCCEGLASYVRDRGDAARLRAVAECAEALNGRVVDVVREVSYLTNGQCESVEKALAEDIMALEATMFDEFLDNICRHVAGCTKLGPTSADLGVNDAPDGGESSLPPKSFPAYLSACLLAIVRCRAQVDRALGDATIRRSQGITYQYLAMATAADGVVAGICYELNERMPRMSGPQADQFASELQFLMNTLKKYLSDDMLSVAENCKRMLFAKAGHKQGGDGPDGLMMIEELERLGRVYVLCLGE